MPETTASLAVGLGARPELYSQVSLKGRFVSCGEKVATVRNVLSLAIGGRLRFAHAYVTTCARALYNDIKIDAPDSPRSQSTSWAARLRHHGRGCAGAAHSYEMGR